LKALITGIGGFVGPYLRRELENAGYEVAGLDKRIDTGAAAAAGGSREILECDITEAEQTLRAVQKIRPDAVFHLAGFSSVAKSFEEPELCRAVNVGGTKNLLAALRETGIAPKVLIVSSAEVYGRPDYLPVDENHPLTPVSPYGESRLEQERAALSGEYAPGGSDIPVIVSRSFNHTGAGQPAAFVIPSFKKQIKEAEDGGVIKTGNLEVVRDFSDVTDVVRAYRILLERGESGEVYNTGSGIPYRLREILKYLIAESGKELFIETDPKRYRPADIPELYADNRKLLDVGGVSFKKLFYENERD
jgi:GDP-4-dehydro-6-deoxy-D-mannose reductase